MKFKTYPKLKAGARDHCRQVHRVALSCVLLELEGDRLAIAVEELDLGSVSVLNVRSGLQTVPLEHGLADGNDLVAAVYLCLGDSLLVL